MTIQKLQRKLQEIQKIGFVKTHRRGDTGIGKTLEDLLEIKENNIPLPDIGETAELKTCRKNTISMLTLFTFEPCPRGGDRDRILLDNFGYSKRKNERSKELHSTLSSKRYNNQNLKLKVEKEKICIISKRKKLNIYWNTEDLKKKLETKIPAMVHVLADQKRIKDIEHFHFNEAYLLERCGFETFKEMIKKDEIVVDFRMYYKPDGHIRNHGTAFRIKINKLYHAFKTKKRLL